VQARLLEALELPLEMIDAHEDEVALDGPRGSFGCQRPSDLGASHDYPNLIVDL